MSDLTRDLGIYDFHDFISDIGLEPVARFIQGDSFYTCSLDLHGVQGCADIRAMIATEHLISEVIALTVAATAVVIAIALVKRTLTHIGTRKPPRTTKTPRSARIDRVLTEA